MSTGHNRPTDGRKAWFGPKRVGWGLRPQTWQGWAVTAAFVVVVVAVAVLVAG